MLRHDSIRTDRPRMAAVLVLFSVAGFPPLHGQGFRGEYYRGTATHPHLPEDIAFTRVDSSISFSGGASWTLPPGFGATALSVRWTGTFDTSAPGEYTFTLRAANEAVLHIDGAPAVELRGAHPAVGGTRRIALAPGSHFLELYYTSVLGGSEIRLSYTPPGGGSPVLLGGSSVSPNVRFGRTARTIGFDAIPAGTYLTDQLLATEGIRLATSLGSGGFYYSRPRVVTSPVDTASPPNMLQNESRDAIEGGPISQGAPLTVTFTRPQQRVALSAGSRVRAPFGGDPATLSPPAVLRAYDSSGRLVAADWAARVPVGVTQRMEIARSQPDIAAIAIDFGHFPYDECIDDLILETSGTAPGTTDLTPPAITILRPRDGQEIASEFGSATVDATVADSGGAIASVTLESGVTARAMDVAPTSAAGCRAPLCQTYTSGLNLPAGSHTLVVRARDAAGNEATARVTVTVVTRTRVHVTNDSGFDVPGAEVFIGGRLRGVTNSAGILETAPLPAGTAIVARLRVHENRSPRSSHDAGSTQNWNYRVYLTSMTVGSDASTSTFLVTSPGAVQELRLWHTNTLIGLHLTASVEWDATRAELENLRDSRFAPASQFLYNATDGQFYIEQVELTDDTGQWGDADFRVYTNRSLRAHVDCRTGGFLFSGVCATFMHMARSNDAPTYAHEFGHYGFDVSDEYADGDPNVRCTRNTATAGGTFGSSQPRTSCMMWNQWQAPKLCSRLGENPHVAGTRQGDEDCWSRLVSRFRDPDTFSRWTLQSPNTRGSIMGMLPTVPVSDWTPRVAIDDRARPNQCEPIEFTVSRLDTGATLRNTRVWNRTTYGPDLDQGTTDDSGNILATGLHVGDQVRAEGTASFTITESLCTAPVRRPLMLSTVDASQPPQAKQAEGAAADKETVPLRLAPDNIRVGASVEPGTKDGQGLVVVRVDSPASEPPAVEIRGAGQKPLIVPMTASGSNFYRGFFDAAEVTEGTLHVAVKTVDGSTEQSFPFRFSPILEKQETEMFSADGQLSLSVPAGALPSDARIGVGPSEAPLPPLPPGYSIAAGPFKVTPSSGKGLATKATLRFRLPFRGRDTGAASFAPTAYEPRRYNADRGGWEPLGALYHPDEAVESVSTAIDEAGSFVLVGLREAAPEAKVAVALSASPETATGPCPAKVQFTGTIEMSGRGTVRYQFERSDGAAGPEQSIGFEAAGRKEVNTTWTLGGPDLPAYSGWQVLRILSPNPVTSEKAVFAVRCTQ